MQVELVSPERILWSGEAEMVITRTLGGGDIAFLPGHAPFVGALGIGVMTIRPTAAAPTRTSPSTAASSRCPTTR